MATKQVAVKINDNQRLALKTIIANGKMPLDPAVVDRRSTKALETRGLVKITETKKGVFVAPTAAGKKLLN